nr:flagellar basal body rod protein FlgB [Salsuginibacillus kocurii]
MSLFSSSALQAAEAGMQGSALKQQTISNNIANVDTPNYSAKRTHFQHTLGEAVENEKLHSYQTDERHMQFGTSQNEPFTTTEEGTMYNHNGNNVDIDKEMAEMAKNQIYYNAMTDRLNSSFNKLQTAVQGG